MAEDRDLSVEITKLVFEFYPDASIGRPAELGKACGDVSDALSGLLFLTKRYAPSETDYVRSFEAVFKRIVDGIHILEDMKP